MPRVATNPKRKVLFMVFSSIGEESLRYFIDYYFKLLVKIIKYFLYIYFIIFIKDMVILIFNYFF